MLGEASPFIVVAAADDNMPCMPCDANLRDPSPLSPFQSCMIFPFYSRRSVFTQVSGRTAFCRQSRAQSCHGRCSSQRAKYSHPIPPASFSRRLWIGSCDVKLPSNSRYGKTHERQIAHSVIMKDSLFLALHKRISPDILIVNRQLRESSTPGHLLSNPSGDFQE